MSAQEIIDQIKELSPVERERVNKFVGETKQNPTKNSPAFLLVKDLCGSLSGPTDLATNPKYLEKLGE